MLEEEAIRLTCKNVNAERSEDHEVINAMLVFNSLRESGCTSFSL